MHTLYNTRCDNNIKLDYYTPRLEKKRATTADVLEFEDMYELKNNFSILKCCCTSFDDERSKKVTPDNGKKEKSKVYPIRFMRSIRRIESYPS